MADPLSLTLDEYSELPNNNHSYGDGQHYSYYEDNYDYNQQEQYHQDYYYSNRQSTSRKRQMHHNNQCNSKYHSNKRGKHNNRSYHHYHHNGYNSYNNNSYSKHNQHHNNTNRNGGRHYHHNRNKADSTQKKSFITKWKRTAAPRTDHVSTPCTKQPQLHSHNFASADPNNHGWPQGYSLEQEFMKQSSKTIVQHHNKAFLTERCIDPNKYPQAPYERRKKHPKKHIIHWGQRKLLLSEIEFLTKHLHNAKKGHDGYVLVIYAGAAPGSHIPLLIEMFDNIRMELFDPNTFSHVVQNKRRIRVHQQYFTDQIAQELGALGRDILFISDIRTADHRRQSGEECEATIMKDNALQSNWVRAMNKGGNLIAAMLKFRMPYPHLIHKDQMKQELLAGTIYLQCFAPVTSTETRLHVVPDRNGQIKTTIYDCTQYEQWLFWFNYKARQSYIDNSKYYTPNVGVIHNYDCYAECKILEQYYVDIKGKSCGDAVMKHDVIRLVNRITRFIGAKRCLLTRPADPSEQKRGLGMVNHSRFHSNQQIANPKKIDTDPHHLYGYEGLLGVDPHDKAQINQMIMNAMKANGYDTDKIKQFDAMLDIVYGGGDDDNGYCVVPSYNRPLYHLLSIEAEVYVIPLNGFSDMWFKMDEHYVSFYNECFGESHGTFCCLTGYLIDNHNTKHSSMRYRFVAIDMLTKVSDGNADLLHDYQQRRKGIEEIVNNYDAFKDSVTQRDIFKFIPIKIEIAPCVSGAAQMKARIKKFINICAYEDVMSGGQRVRWSDIHYDMKEYETPPNGYYFDNVALNTRIGGWLSIHNRCQNVMISGSHYVKFTKIDC
eukprot:938314_1